MILNATYSPNDNKLRLYASERLPLELYERIKAAGFKWAPKQDLFYAPMWTPEREALLLELCDSIEDEDISLEERAAERAERFQDYRENRLEDYESAKNAVSQIADNIPLGQPILIGHHSERRARKDAERIENGMRRAVKMWDTAEYWKQRAAAAIRHAKYKERADVRARRIKTIEADKRKQERNKSEIERKIKLWQIIDNADAWKARADGTKPTREERAQRIADATYAPMEKSKYGYWTAHDVLQPKSDIYPDRPQYTVDQAQAKALEFYGAELARIEKWIQHYNNRLEYERAMLAESGGTAADQNGPETGGACKCWVSSRGQWLYIKKKNKVTVTVMDNWGNGGRNFPRTVPFDKLSAIMSAAQVKEASDNGLIVETQDGTGFYLRQSPDDNTREETHDEVQDRKHAEHLAAIQKPTEAETVKAMRAAADAGIQVITAPQLFPTPTELARRMVQAADISTGGGAIMEPSAGTGNIISEITAKGFLEYGGKLCAVEINRSLADNLKRQRERTLYANESNFNIINGDFLQYGAELGQFDRILMNPPFHNAADIEHITHALKFLKPGGRIVAICANGPRQNEKLKPLATTWETLPAGTFKQSGTEVNTVLLTIEA